MMNKVETSIDLLVFSTEIDMDYIAPFAKVRRIFKINTPLFGDISTPTYFLRLSTDNIYFVRPHLPKESSVFEQKESMLKILKELISEQHLFQYAIWTDSPKAMPYIRSLNAETIIYDRVQNYSKSYPELEAELLEYADLVIENDLTSSQNAWPGIHSVEQSSSRDTLQATYSPHQEPAGH